MFTNDDKNDGSMVLIRSRDTPQPRPSWWKGPQRDVTGRIRGQKYRKGVEEGQARDGGLVHLVATAFVPGVLEAPQLDTGTKTTAACLSSDRRWSERMRQQYLPATFVRVLRHYRAVGT